MNESEAYTDAQLDELTARLRVVDWVPGSSIVHRLLATVHKLQAEATAQRRWEDVPDEWNEAVHAAFPTRSGSHDEYGKAQRMINSRHAKGALIALVNWLLVELRDTAESLRELADASEEAASADPGMPSHAGSAIRFDEALDAARAILSRKR